MHIRKGWGLILVLLLGTLLVPGLARAQVTGELNLNGVAGDDPDTVIAAVGDSVIVFLRLDATAVDLIQFSAFLCTDSGNLQFGSAEYLTPIDWINDPPQAVGTCLVVASLDPSPSTPTALNIPLPEDVVRIAYFAAAPDTVEIAILCDKSTWRDDNENSGTLTCDPGTGYVIITGPTAVDESSWGRIKALYK